ncbi:HD family phosphohydrolase [Candidatus Magnetoovum chiemensis]|nr:HD family phosphohydrolase [Candidatus Magnetoovum chiemensis]
MTMPNVMMSQFCIINNREIAYHFHCEDETIKLLNQASTLKTYEIVKLINDKLHDFFHFDHLSLIELLPNKKGKQSAVFYRSFQKSAHNENWSKSRTNFELSSAILDVYNMLDTESDDIEIREIPNLREFIESTYSITADKIEELLTSPIENHKDVLLSPAFALLKDGYNSSLRIFFKAYKKIYMLQISNKEAGRIFQINRDKYEKLQMLITVLKTAFVKQDAIELLKRKLFREFEIGFTNWTRFTSSLTQIKHQVTGDHSWRCYLKAKPILNYLLKIKFEGLTLTNEEKEGIEILGAEIVSALVMLHDIGKMGLPDTLLNNSDALTKEEYDKIKQHPLLGKSVAVTAKEDLTDFLSNFDDTAKIQMRLSIIYDFLEDITGGHHEDFDGSGYPERKKGYEIPFLARLTRAIDTHDGALHSRSYQRAMTKDKLLNYLNNNKNTKFDSAIVDLIFLFSDEFDKIDQQYPDTAA